MKRRSLATLLLIAAQSVGFAQEPKTNQTPAAIQGILKTFLQVTNTVSPTFNIFSATDDISHTYVRNRASTFVGSTIGGTGIDLTAIPAWANWDSPPPTGGNPYGGARFNGILVTPDILLQAHHTWAASGYAPETLYFVDNQNQTVAVTVAGHRGIAGTDIEIVRLAKKAPPSITPAGVFASGAIAHSVIPVLWTDQYRELYIGGATLADNNFIIVSEAATAPFNSYWATAHNGVVSGDSGAPYMTIVKGRLVALGTWETGGSQRGGGSSFESQVSAIDTAIKALGSSTALRTVDFGETP